MNKPWLQHYPDGVPAEMPPFPYRSLGELLGEAFGKHGEAAAFHFMGATMSFRELDEHSRAFAAYLQSLGLKPKDRVALMMPNVPQYPVAVAGVLRAGMVVVNTNPLYTPRELTHQLGDSGAKALVILENMAKTYEACRAETKIEHVVIASLGDMLPTIKGFIVNLMVRKIKKLVPDFSLPGAVRFPDAIRSGKKARFSKVETALDDIAVLQYTGGTTGVSKGATLTHGNIVANVLQSETWNRPAMTKVPAGVQPTTVCALPLYHIFGFTVNMMLSMRTGGANILIPNPRDIPATLKELKRHRFHSFPAVNTLFGAIARHPAAKSVDWSHLKISLGGGMAVQHATADLWRKTTGCAICEGYGLSETSPSASCNPCDLTEYTGTIGMPLPSTDMRVIGDDGVELPLGERGEIAIKGPQVMAGYWNRPEETAKVMTADGFFRTGDIGVMDERGCFTIVDRKKDMINVSGFNVYPNEVEEVVTRMPGIVEAAAVAMADESSGEAVKLYVVKSDQSITADKVKAFCKDHLTGYKRPKEVAFKDELPKTNVGKVLRRELRD